MNRSYNNARTPTRSLIRRIGVRIGIVALMALAVVSWSVFVEMPHAPGTASVAPDAVGRSASAGWGGEALTTSPERAPTWSPIPVANACGLGTSSCFKCHNGQRAMAPKMDKATGLWHVQHMHVNDDCVGCHAGNPRIIKKELAHADLVADPRSKPERCAACHKSEDTAALMKQYQKTK